MASSSGDAAHPPKQHVLSTAYQSATNQPFSFSWASSAPNAENVEERTKYLRDLRNAVLDTQERINKELTARMEEDKARDATGPKIPDVDEAKEEENYGEEVVEEEE
jgi:hypothetical protein